MISFSKTLAATWLPGYYFDVIEKILYSIKIRGELKKLKLRAGSKYFCKSYAINVVRFNDFVKQCNREPYYYVVSRKGKRHYFFASYLENLKVKNVKVPYANPKKNRSSRHA